MSTTGRDGGDRRVGDFAIALICLVAFGLIAVALAGAGGALGSADTSEVDDSIDDEPATGDRPNVIGSGSLGSADRNPIGTAIGDGPNPFVSTSSERQFVVVGDQPGYWRVDAYGEYDDGAWMRTGEASAYDDELQPTGSPAETVTHRVSLEQDATVLPTAWEPARVTDTDDSSLSVSTESGVHTDSPMSAGNTYTVERYHYEVRPGGLQNTWGAYPISIERQYTQVPETVPDRVETLAAEIAADAETPYETLLAITEWIDTNREYDRAATHDSDNDPVDEFLFEMEAGNAEYMASSTALLLRSEGTPARYVTGYTPGEAIADADDTYAVHAVNAHAWTEVYFSGYGWVPIDPTPSEDRVTVESEAIDPDGELIGLTPTMDALLNPPELSDDTTQIDLDDEQTADDDQTAPEQEPDDDSGDTGDDSTGGFPSGSTDDDTSDTSDDSDDSDDSDTSDDPDDADDDDTADDSIDSGNSDTGDEEPDTEDETESGTDDGDPDTTQETDDETTIALSSVPPSPGEAVTVTVTDDDGPRSDATVRFDGERIGTTDANGAVNGTVPFTETVSVEVTPDEADIDTETVTATFPVATDVTIAPEPVPLVLGGEASVQAHVNGEPVPDATVYLDDEQVGTTDGAGEAAFAVPDDLDREEITLAVRRGEIEGERTVTAGQLRLMPESKTVLAMPGQGITLTATVGSTPVPGVEIDDGSTVVATTDANGEATVSASFRTVTTITGSYSGQETTTQVENRLIPVTLGAGALATGIIGVGVFVRRRSGLLSTARQRTELWVRKSIDAGIGTILWVEDVLGSTRGQARTTLLPLLRRLLRVPFVAVRRLRSVLAELFARLGRMRTLSRDTDRAPAPSTGDPVEESETVDSRDHEPRNAIRQAWATFARLVFRRIDPTWTPGEVARKAIATGLPSGPVQRLTDTFRVVEYGRADPESRIDDATGALTEIEGTSTDRQNADRSADKDDKRSADDR